MAQRNSYSHNPKRSQRKLPVKSKSLINPSKTELGKVSKVVLDDSKVVLNQQQHP